MLLDSNVGRSVDMALLMDDALPDQQPRDWINEKDVVLPVSCRARTAS